MTAIALVPWPETTWGPSRRLAGRTPLPLSAEGRKRALEWARELESSKIDVVFSGEDQASAETAQILAEHCSAKQKVVSDLGEVDVGLWEGLTPDELARRYPKVYKRWRDDPLTVCPPDGESPDHATQRLGEALAQVLGKQGENTAAVITGPIAYGFSRILLEHGGNSAPVFDAPIGPVVYHELLHQPDGSFRIQSATEVGAVAASCEKRVEES